MNGDVGLCAPTSNDTVRIHIASWRICAKSFCRLEISTANQSTLVLCGNRDIIVIFSQMRVFVCIDPFHRMDLANLPQSVVRTSSSVKIIPAFEVQPLVPFDVFRLSESGLHIGRAGSEVKMSLTVFLQHFLLVAFPHTSHPHLKKSISEMFAVPFPEQI